MAPSSRSFAASFLHHFSVPRCGLTRMLFDRHLRCFRAWRNFDELNAIPGGHLLQMRSLYQTVIANVHRLYANSRPSQSFVVVIVGIRIACCPHGELERHELRFRELLIADIAIKTVDFHHASLLSAQEQKPLGSVLHGWLVSSRITSIHSQSRHLMTSSRAGRPSSHGSGSLGWPLGLRFSSTLTTYSAITHHAPDGSICRMPAAGHRYHTRKHALER